MILTLVVQNNYDGTISISEVVNQEGINFYEIARGINIKEAKKNAINYFKNSDYKLNFINEFGKEA